ncbi:hypothetical protein Tco_0650089 [Tanacetum coccineum]
MSTLKFAETHNLVAFLEKPKESNGVKGIINFLNASSIKYALTIQALVDKKKLTITEKSMRSNLMLEDVKGIECLPMMKQRKDNGPTEPIPDEANNKEPISTPSYEPPQNTEDRLQLTELMNLLTLIDETQERSDEEMLFDVQDDLQGEEIFAEQEVAEKEVSAADLVTTTSATTTIDELTLAQTLIEIKAAKPKAVTTSATTITTAIASTRPMAKGIVFHDQEEQASAFTPIVSSSQLPQAKDKGKGKMVEPKKPLKKKDQIALDEELALRLHAKEQAELEKKELHKKKLAEKVKNVSGDDSLKGKVILQHRSRRERSNDLTLPRLMIRNRMCAYLKNMGGYKHNQLKGLSYEEIHKLYDKAHKQVNSFDPMDSEVVKSSETRTEGNYKRVGDKLESDKSKKQKIDVHVEAKKDDD